MRSISTGISLVDLATEKPPAVLAAGGFVTFSNYTPRVGDGGRRQAGFVENKNLLAAVTFVKRISPADSALSLRLLACDIGVNN